MSDEVKAPSEQLCGCYCHQPASGIMRCTCCTPSPESQPEKITHTAILKPNCQPVADHALALSLPANHYEVAKALALEGETPLKWPQGFLTSTGRFVDRKEAKRIAEAAGQIANPISGSEDLFSEELWIPSAPSPEVKPQQKTSEDAQSLAIALTVAQSACPFSGVHASFTGSCHRCGHSRSTNALIEKYLSPQPQQTVETARPACEICGGHRVYIRGRHPGDPRRLVCPTCLAERMDTINEISSRHYGVAYTEKPHAE